MVIPRQVARRFTDLWARRPKAAKLAKLVVDLELAAMMHERQMMRWPRRLLVLICAPRAIGSARRRSMWPVMTGRTLVVVATEVSVGVVGCLLVLGFAGHVVEVAFDDG